MTMEASDLNRYVPEKFRPWFENYSKYTGKNPLPICEDEDIPVCHGSRTFKNICHAAVERLPVVTMGACGLGAQPAVNQP